MRRGGHRHPNCHALGCAAVDVLDTLINYLSGRFGVVAAQRLVSANVVMELRQDSDFSVIATQIAFTDLELMPTSATPRATAFYR